jgi:NAD(P)-dependent dehydrogenase (short-subunit alcohol dehydrogenase family)
MTTTQPVRTAIVTGGAKGIGRVVSEHLARAGWQLVLCARDRAALDAAATEIQGRHGVRVERRVLDLSQPEAAAALFAEWPSAAELPQALVCGAADYGVLGALESVEFEAWKRSFDLNFFSVAELIQRYVRLALGGGQVSRRGIIVMGGAGLGGAQVAGGISSYSCAKAAVYRLVEVVHEEVNARGIDINCVLPGLVDTGIVDQALAAGPALGHVYEASLKARSGGGTPPDVAAEVIVQLLEESCRGVSGRLISARWDRAALAAPAALASDADLFRLRRIDNDLYRRAK